MANYATLKAAIQAVIKQNGNKEITGSLLQDSLLSMISSLGAYFQFAGIATPATNPGTPDQNVFYIAATGGTYVNFGGIEVENGDIAILKYNGTWSKDVTGIPSGYLMDGKINWEYFVTGPQIEWEDGKYLSLANGSVDSYSGWSVSPLIEIDFYGGYCQFSGSCGGGGTASICFYDENENYLDGVVAATYNKESILIPENTKYVRFCSYTAGKNSLYFGFVNFKFLMPEYTVGKLVQSGNFADESKYSVWGARINKYNKLKSFALRSGANVNRDIYLHVVDLATAEILETITKTLAPGVNTLYPSIFTTVVNASERDLGIFFENLDSDNRMIPFIFGEIVDNPSVNISSTHPVSFVVDQGLALAMTFTFERQEIPYINKRISDLEMFCGILTAKNLKNLIDNSNGNVWLGPGYYYISTPIQLPNNVKISGVRGRTILYCNNASECFYLTADNEHITLENLTFLGPNQITPTATNLATVRARSGEGTRCGIYIAGYAKDIHIRNCEFKNFDLAGIRIRYHHAGIYYNKCKITDCGFTNCFYGLLSDVRSEYHTVVGCSMCYNQIGCFIEGGNNFMSCCHFEANAVGCVVSGMQNNNDSHGTIGSSSFNHNISAGIMCIDVNNGFCFEGCHIFEGGMYIDASKGINYNGGILACNVYISNTIENTHNLIHNVIFSDTSYNYTITGADETISLKNNRYIDLADSSNINNNY